MKIKSGFWILCFTCASVLAGFCLPKLTAEYQDRQVKAQKVAYKSEEVRFSSSYQILDCIRLLSEGYKRVDMEEGREHTAAQISEIAQDVSDKLKQYNYLWPGQGKMSAEDCRPFLAVGGFTETDAATPYEWVWQGKREVVLDNGNREIVIDASPFSQEKVTKSFSAIIWECTYADADGNRMTLYIDDQSGKMISATYDCQNRSLYYEVKVTEQYMELFDSSFRDFIREYYGMKDVAIEHIYSEDQGYFLIDLQDKSGSQLRLTIRFSGYRWEYNPPLSEK